MLPSFLGHMHFPIVYILQVFTDWFFFFFFFKKKIVCSTEIKIRVQEKKILAQKMKLIGPFRMEPGVCLEVFHISSSACTP